MPSLGVRSQWFQSFQIELLQELSRENSCRPQNNEKRLLFTNEFHFESNEILSKIHKLCDEIIFEVDKQVHNFEIIGGLIVKTFACCVSCML